MNRGQSTVELALALLVFIPILLFGIHFAEAGAITLRVTQAANSAMWDTTGMRMHRFNNAQTSPAIFRNSDQMKDGNNRTPEQRAENFYNDFDGLSSSNGGLTVTQALSRGSSLNVRCNPATVSPLPGAARFDNAFLSYHAAAGNRDGMSCQASGRIETWMIPTHFQEKSGGSYFNAQLVQLTSFKVCAFGRASGGSCMGGVPLALDDWALSGSDDATYGSELRNCNANCAFNGTGNHAYRQQVARIYDGYNNLSSQVVRDFMVSLFVGDGKVEVVDGVPTATPVVPELANVPVDERAFRIAFVGEEGDNGSGPFKLTTREQDMTNAFDYEWATTPAAQAYGTAYGNRGHCFLGTKCNEPVFDKQSW